MPVITIRPFNTYGPRQSARAVIPTIITQLANGVESLKLGSVHPTRDFNYVQDTVDGFIAALKAENAFGETINLGSNFEISIGDTVSVIAELMNKSITIETDDKRLRPKDSEVERLWADNKKAADLLHWKPKYGGLEGFKAGISKTIEWFSKPENLSNYKSDIYNV